MKTENFVISLIAVGAIWFFLGRLSMPTGDDAKKAEKSLPTAQKTDDAKEAKGDAAPANAAAAAQGGAAAAAKPAPSAVAAKPRALPRGRGQIAVVESPFKGPKDAKVTIMEISDFQ